LRHWAIAARRSAMVLTTVIIGGSSSTAHHPAQHSHGECCTGEGTCKETEAQCGREVRGGTGAVGWGRWPGANKFSGPGKRRGGPSAAYCATALPISSPISA